MNNTLTSWLTELPEDIKENDGAWVAYLVEPDHFRVFETEELSVFFRKCIDKFKSSSGTEGMLFAVWYEITPKCLIVAALPERKIKNMTLSGWVTCDIKDFPQHLLSGCFKNINECNYVGVSGI